MSRSLAAIVGPLLLVLAATSQAQDHAELPVAEGMHLSNLLSRDVDGFSYEASILLAQCDNYEDIEYKVRNVRRELSDLNRSLREAAQRPSRWDRVSRQTEEVREAVHRLREELQTTVREFRREQDRQRFHAPHHFDALRAPSHPVTHIGRSSDIRMAGNLYPDRYPPLPAPRPFGANLEDRVWLMERLARQLHELAQQP